MVKENLQEVIHNMEIACKNSGRDMKDVTRKIQMILLWKFMRVV